jgi:hypothetical protein
MDTSKLIRDAKARFDFNTQKQELKDKYEGKLIFADQGGLFTAGPNLFATLQAITQAHVIIVDNYGNPVKVDSNKLLIKATKLYNEVMQEWHDELQSMQEIR